MAGSDTRTCPHCRETLKREAVKCRFCGQALLPAADTADLVHPQMSSPARAADKARQLKDETPAFRIPGTKEIPGLASEKEPVGVERTMYVCPKCARGFEGDVKLAGKIRCPHADCGFEFLARTKTLHDAALAEKREMVIALAVVAGPDEGRRVEVGSAATTIGSAEDCDLVLTDATVADVHARVVVTGREVTVGACTEEGAILVNGKRCGSARIAHGDLISVGKTTIEVAITYQAKPVSAKAQGKMLSTEFTKKARVLVGGEEATRIPLGVAPVTFGRSNTRDVQLDSPLVSKKHATVVYEGGRHYIVDNGSKSGTLVGGEAVIRRALAEGDLMQIGPFVFSYKGGSLVRERW
ncbi:MAG: FHA domain-containing protein [Planctomycetota bacterium]